MTAAPALTTKKRFKILCNDWSAPATTLANALEVVRMFLLNELKSEGLVVLHPDGSEVAFEITVRVPNHSAVPRGSSVETETAKMLLRDVGVTTTEQTKQLFQSIRQSQQDEMPMTAYADLLLSACRLWCDEEEEAA